MYQYIKGTITDIDSKYIVVDNGGIGYQIYVSNPFIYQDNQKVQVYIYQHIREDINQLYGFVSKDYKNLFLSLLAVKGIGPKSALAILATGTIEGIVNAIETENVLYLRKFPGIGPKAAAQMILDLKGKLVVSSEDVNQSNYDEVIDALLSLGYKSKDASRVVSKLANDLTLEDAIKESLKLLLK